MSRTRCITLLGSTGSIGRSTLSVIEQNDGIEIWALTGHSNVELLVEQCIRYQPRVAVIADAGRERDLRQALAGQVRTEVLSGEEGLLQVASEPRVDTVMAAIVGSAGLAPALAAAHAGKKILLANKEALVMAGELFLDAVNSGGGQIIPMDSEHNAIFQCLPMDSGLRPQLGQVEKLVLTASGGPFRERDPGSLAHVTPEEACSHPNWSMGAKISVDSATMMNKGLELIEASLLFGLPASKIDVLVHPQSVVHSLVHFLDGSVLAQLGCADMRIPISSGFAWPERLVSGAQSLDLAATGNLRFFEPDLQRFPCLGLGMEAAKQRGTAPAILNAANEVAVASFLKGRIPFTAIAEIAATVLDKIPCEEAASLAIIQEIDFKSREHANNLISKDF